MDGRRSIVVAHGQAPVRLGLRESLRGRGFEIVGEAADAAAAIELALRERPRLCILDQGMPGSISVARRISSRLPETAVLMMTSSGTAGDLIDALRAGAVGCLPASLDPARLPHALDAVLAGEAAVPRRLAVGLVEAFRSQERHRMVLRGARRVELSRREWEVLELMHEGLTTSQTAERLLLSPVTVRRHLSTIVKKLGVADRNAALSLLDANL
jgi:DNA-binding NarL/FixJ family response regulator